MTEVYFIDGQQLTPSSFGQTNPNTGVWEPINYAGTYGTNGFELSFADNSNNTAATLGKDTSGNGNNWTPNNFSVAAGAGNDSLVDAPTAYGTDTGIGGSVRGNYCTWNSAAPSTVVNGTVTRSDGNLVSTDGGTTYGLASFGTIAVSSGKWYWEVTMTSAGGIYQNIGIVDVSQPLYAANHTGYCYAGGGNKSGPSNPFQGTGSTAYGSSYTTGDIIGIALDMDAKTVTFYKNNVSQGVAFTGLTGVYAPGVGDGQNATSYTFTLNAGQRAFAYTAPSGFQALCTQNLPTPTIGATSTTQANDYFDVTLYTGNNTAGTNITNSGGFQPDFVWIKNRSGANNHILTDAVRGATKTLFSDSTSAELTVAGALTAFNSNGFQVGYDGTAIVNASANNYVAWQWNAGGSTVTNTSGTISAQVRASTTSGCSIITYTGNGSANQTVGHGLGVAPAFGILKDRDTNSNNDQWQIFHTGAGDKYGYFTTAAFAGTAEFYPTSGSSTTVTIARGSPAATTNENGDRYVMYLFTPVAGYSAFGSYTGNGSSDGPFIFTNFRPRWVLVKASSTTSQWVLWDTARNTYNVTDDILYPNLSAAENVNGFAIDIVSNGFKFRESGGAGNDSGVTYIYAAFAEFPFKYSLAR
jgi:hypothetical protein